ncbi:MAG: glycosyltransferase family 2 protein [Candidatus Binatia bacterium]
MTGLDDAATLRGRPWRDRAAASGGGTDQLGAAGSGAAVEHAAGIRADVVAVILSWNDADRVVALLRRLRSADPRPGHVVVVDNGSAEGCAARIASEFPEHEVLCLEANFGFAAAVNRGIGRAVERDAAWVWLLNSDIALPPTALASLLATAGADQRCGMAGAVLTEPDGTIQARGGGRVSLWTGSSTHVRRSHERCDYLSAACLLIRTAMLRDTGAFDENYFFYWEDVDLGFRARAAGWTLGVAEDCVVVHDEGSSLGRWSEQRWFHLFRGMSLFLHARARLPRTATAFRLVVHVATMLRHGRRDAARGAWRGAIAERLR